MVDKTSSYLVRSLEQILYGDSCWPSVKINGESTAIRVIYYQPVINHYVLFSVTHIEIYSFCGPNGTPDFYVNVKKI